ncbi:L2 [Martes foina papillomavirus 1]|uniref:Minor capsid protein L2 n=1 Tax=Martes foina papillomavirus 1 TaxID=2831903 RepID=A0AAE7RDB8_9PAPI|nr:L2 [Martes foina papillomavirus 1]
MARARRTKRASATQLYQTCKQAGTCPPDVVNKIEGKTIADKILQYGSAGVFLGGLGISTGAGRGGRFGYTPVGADPAGGVRVGSTAVVRPPVLVDAVGPVEVVPVDALDPALVPLIDADLDASVTLVESTAEVPPANPRVPVGGAGGSPVVTSDTSSAAVLEIAPETVSRSAVSRSHHVNPAFEVSTGHGGSYGESSMPHTFYVTHSSEGTTIGEEIPLREFPRTSTPRATPRPTTAAPRRGGYPRRFLEQVPVDDPAFVSTPQRLVVFDVENPAYDVSLEFPLAPDEVRAAPDQRFRDVVYLSRPALQEGQGRAVRVSRFGRRGTLSTRAGTQIGSQAHFFHDLSSISAAEEIELSVLGEQSGEAITIQDVSDSGSFEVIDLDSSDTISHETGSHSSLLDDDVPLIQGRLVFGTGRDASTIEVAVRASSFGYAPNLDLDAPGGGVAVAYPGPTSTSIAWIPLGPAHAPQTDLGGSTYFLHPSLRRKRRRRLRRRYV